MPHLVIQYSENIEPRIDMKQLCDQLGDTICASDMFPKGGVRVRAYPAAAYSIADQHPQNAFIDLVLRIGAGRTQDQKRNFGQALIDQVSEICQDLLAEPHFALSLEIIEIDPDLSWKVNTIHPRLKSNS
ncbi:5-carboxymethyl-2-hydroxymuconate Delta-isomerase [Maritalea porphyrae]|uniref:5-carboxymethyl-2-hydroxymuconate Delta-isomerase n=1 Tax=Maritalea porphyrae TaxID=880732 RepID=UPI0022B0396B|nr:5-carboxymethyl-2-hydroxymuconate Delta-isomerase [Maritalea porphyrae]MCZ4272813.1 5-carboxymethyl-2-hydroxymuconate Delta-isomerase [Maritalea porphyrae]